jgi:hypothetical protein
MQLLINDLESGNEFSEEKAKGAIIYNYKNVVSGFSARLTPSELEAVKSE